MTTILDNIKLVLSNDKYEDTKLRILEKVKEQILQSVSPKEKRKLESKSEGHSEWNRRKGLVNVNNGKIGDYDFSYIFKLYEVSESQKTVESLAVPPTGPPTGPPLAPAGPSAGHPPPPPLPPPALASTRVSTTGRKLKKLHWSVLPLSQTKGDTIWSSSSKVDWDKVTRLHIGTFQILSFLELLQPNIH